MKPIKATQILKADLHNNSLDDPIDLHAAEKLGIEALKRILTMRSYGIKQAILPLPGEKSIEDHGLSHDQLPNP